MTVRRGTVEQGERRTSAIVLIHGDFGDGGDAWAPLVDQIGDRYRVVVLDRPGFRGEHVPEGRLTIAGDAQHAFQAIRAEGIDAMHLVGHSYGGLVAIEMAVQSPDLVRSLHLIEPPLLRLLPDDPDVQTMDRRVREIQAAFPVRGSDQTTAAFFSMIGADYVVERLRGTAEWARLCGYAARFARNEPPGDFPLENLERLPDCLPIAVYSGGRSHPALRAIAAKLVQRPGVVAFIDVPGAGHAVQMAGAPFLEPLLRLVDETDAEQATTRAG